MFFPAPDFKGFDFFPHNMRVPFMRYNVDFKGGSLIEVQHKNGPADLADMRQKLNALGIGSVQIQSFGSDSDVLIRVEQQAGDEIAQQQAMKKVIDTLGPEYTQRRIEVVGAAVSSELRRTGVIAVIASLLAISAYVWFRFEWQFAAGCVISLLHDVLVTVGVFAAFQLEFDLSIVAALLTILGYSVNDSVVVSDRIRENLRKYKRMDLTELLNLSINETLSRTILTGLTTIVGIIALLVFGGEVIRNFSFAMLFGIVIGTYSSMFIAAPLLGYLGVKREGVGVHTAAAAASKETSGGGSAATKVPAAGALAATNKAGRRA